VDAEPGEHVLLRITDTGKGMDEYTRSHLFEPFFTTKSQGEGTGLGLATVFGIVKHSGGHIHVSSEVGQGTIFSVYLPRCETGDPGKVRRELQRDLRSLELERSGIETVLVVEDEDAVRDQAVLVLSSYGYSVLDAADAQAAIETSRNYPGPIDLLLTDVIMPGLNGRELADQLQAERPETRVLYISGYAGDAIESHGVQAQGLAFLAKPFTLEDLLRKVRSVLDQGKNNHNNLTHKK